MKKTRNLLSLIFALAALLALTACGPASAGNTTPYTPAELARVVLATEAELPVMQTLTPRDAAFATHLEVRYNLAAEAVEDGVICYPKGFDATEVAVLRLAEDADPASAEAALKAYVTAREKAFTGYAPEAAAVAARGRVAAQGRYVALLICEGDGAESAFLACFGDDPPPLPQLALPETQSSEPEPAPDASQSASEAVSEAPEPEPAEDSYDHDAVLDAWQTGDDSTLSKKNLAVLRRAGEVVDQVITDEMSAYEKELAIHDWIIGWAAYDWAELSADTGLAPDPDHDNPYGVLVNKTAICSGYSSTFQLFMDMLGIECITVEGTANADYEEHAWNMVKLEGEWYCVDVTWDDPVTDSRLSASVRHRFFNVTSQFLRDTSHHWDEATAPEATATAQGWKP